MRVYLLTLAAAAMLAAQERFAGSDDIDRVIRQALENDEMPGAVAWIGQNEKSSIARPTAAVAWRRHVSR